MLDLFRTTDSSLTFKLFFTATNSNNCIEHNSVTGCCSCTNVHVLSISIHHRPCFTHKLKNPWWISLSGFDIMAATLFRLGWRTFKTIHTKNFNYSDNYIIFHTSGQQLSVYSLHCSYVVWCFKCFCSLKPGRFWLASDWKIVQKVILMILFMSLLW